MKKILFTGVSGLLGRYFLLNKPNRCEVIGIYNNTHVSNNLEPFINKLAKIDITNIKSLGRFINTIKPDMIIHAASLGNVDYCENHPDHAVKVNVEGTKNIVLESEKVGASLIFISSNAVYDGNNSPYTETSKRNPLDMYGKTKRDGENIVKKISTSYIILRLITMYGWNPNGARDNPVTWVIKNLEANKTIYVVNDIFNNHLYANEAARIIWNIIAKGISTCSTFNIAGKECISRYELALHTAKMFNLNSKLITPVNSNYFVNIAPRPKNTCFSTQKIDKFLKIKPLHIIQGLQSMKNELYH